MFSKKKEYNVRFIFLEPKVRISQQIRKIRMEWNNYDLSQKV